MSLNHLRGSLFLFHRRFGYTCNHDGICASGHICDPSQVVLDDHGVYQEEVEGHVGDNY